MSAAKRRYQKNMRAAYVMDLPLEEYVRRLVMEELPYRLSTKRLIRVLQRGSDGIPPR